MSCIHLTLLALYKLCSVLFALGFFLFLPAGTLFWPRALLVSVILISGIVILGIILYFKAPNLLKNRLLGTEEDHRQRMLATIFSLVTAAGFLAAGLDWRLHHRAVTSWTLILGFVMALCAVLLYISVLRHNPWLSRTVKVQTTQTVICTGPYSVIRHPLYLSGILLYLSISVVLDSLINFVIFCLLPVIYILRIRLEEETLSNHLPGYAEYCNHVRYRLLPWIW